MGLVQWGWALLLPSRLLYPVGRGVRTGWRDEVLPSKWSPDICHQLMEGIRRKARHLPPWAVCVCLPSTGTNDAVARRSQANGKRQWARHRRQERWNAVDYTARCNMMQLGSAASRAPFSLRSAVATLHPEFLCCARGDVAFSWSSHCNCLILATIYLQRGRRLLALNWCYFSGGAVTLSVKLLCRRRRKSWVINPVLYMW